MPGVGCTGGVGVCAVAIPAVSNKAAAKEYIVFVFIIDNSLVSIRRKKNSCRIRKSFFEMILGEHLPLSGKE